MTMNFTHQQALFGRSNASRAAAPGRRAAAMAVFAVLLSSSAYGADYSTPRDLPDYSLRGSETAPVGAPDYPRWEGFYFGAQGGQTFGAADFSNGTSSLISDILANTELQPIVSNWSTLPKGSTGGQSYGGFIGYNYQWDDIVLGAELNYNRMSLRTGQQGSIGPILVPGADLPNKSTVFYSVIVTSAATVAIHDIMTARARAGWTFDRFMPYGFAGLAVGRADVTRFATLAGTTKTTTPPPSVDPITGFQVPGVPVTLPLNLPRDPESQSQGGLITYGFTAGLGVEVGVTPNVFLRAEWEFVEFPNISDFRVQINSARVGVGLKF